eukprot:1910355-Prymnesium_polylepis.1
MPRAGRFAAAVRMLTGEPSVIVVSVRVRYGRRGTERVSMYLALGDPPSGWFVVWRFGLQEYTIVLTVVCGGCFSFAVFLLPR